MKPSKRPMRPVANNEFVENITSSPTTYSNQHTQPSSTSSEKQQSSKQDPFSNQYTSQKPKSTEQIESSDSYRSNNQNTQESNQSLTKVKGNAYTNSTTSQLHSKFLFNYDFFREK